MWESLPRAAWAGHWQGQSSKGGGVAGGRAGLRCCGLFRSRQAPCTPSVLSHKLVVLVTVKRLAGYHSLYFFRDQWSAAGHPPPPKTNPSAIWEDKAGQALGWPICHEIMPKLTVCVTQWQWAGALSSPSPCLHQARTRRCCVDWDRVAHRTWHSPWPGPREES